MPESNQMFGKSSGDIPDFLDLHDRWKHYKDLIRKTKRKDGTLQLFFSNENWPMAQTSIREIAREAIATFNM